MTVVCAWCSKNVEGGPSTEPVSHGICPTCRATYFPKK